MTSLRPGVFLGVIAGYLVVAGRNTDMNRVERSSNAFPFPFIKLTRHDHTIYLVEEHVTDEVMGRIRTWLSVDARTNLRELGEGPKVLVGNAIGAHRRKLEQQSRPRGGRQAYMLHRRGHNAHT
jgi:hypothetical protein